VQFHSTGAPATALEGYRDQPRLPLDRRLPHRHLRGLSGARSSCSTTCVPPCARRSGARPRWRTRRQRVRRHPIAISD